MFIKADTIDDLMHECFELLLNCSNKISPSQGPASEEFGTLFELTNPGARLSLTELKGKAFSCIGELFWYLSGSDSLEFIQYYIPVYKDHSDDKRTLQGAYGPRIFSQTGVAQYTQLKETLSKKRDTRHGVIQLIQAGDLAKKTKDVPCTCTLQFAVRDGQLHLLTSMRSNDAFLGLPHDIFCFTMLQEILARDLDIELGTYKHSVGSFHLYDRNIDTAKAYLEAGWQSTRQMPEMPKGDPWESIAAVIQAEQAIRKGESLDITSLRLLDPYWLDLIRLLQIFSISKRKGGNDEVIKVKKLMNSPSYNPYIDLRISGFPKN